MQDLRGYQSVFDEDLSADWYSQQRFGDITASFFMVVQNQCVFLDCPEDRGRT
jgi:hypothetical protein